MVAVEAMPARPTLAVPRSNLACRTTAPETIAMPGAAITTGPVPPLRSESPIIATADPTLPRVDRAGSL